MPKWEDLVEKKIQEAMKEGAFDNLPGQGQPLNLEENPFEDPTLRTAHRMLRQHGFAPAWIEERKEIEAAIDETRTRLARSWSIYQRAQESRRAAAAEGEAEWQQQLSAFRRQVTDLNRRIASYNLKAPSGSFQRLPLDAEREIQNVRQGNNSS